MHAIRLMRCAAGLLIFTAVVEPVGGQSRLVRAKLTANVYFINVDYGEQRVMGQGIILRGEPVDIDISVSNPGVVGDLPVGVEPDWKDRVAVRIRAGGYRDVDVTGGRAMMCSWLQRAHRTSGLRQLENGHIVLNVDGSITETCRIDSTSLAAGKHTVTIDWGLNTNRKSLRELIPNELPTAIEFELRELSTEPDEVDQLIHLALRAIDEGRLTSASQLVDSALSREPFSSSALILRGRIHLARGSCAAAAADWQLAASVIENGSDTNNRRDRTVLLDDQKRRTVADSWRLQAKRLGCK